MWEVVMVGCGDTISFPWPKVGCRSYLAVAGGVDVPRVMGSRSTHTRSRIGGFEGRPLCAEDRLNSGQAYPKILERRLPTQYVPEYRDQNELRVIMGPQDDHFTEEGICTFLGSEYTISIKADRMGYRLEGPPIEHKAGADIISDGIPLGAVQVPGDRLPIILLADRQTTGGYTKIAVVITADINKLAQAKPGDKVRFLQITEEEAHQCLKEYEQTIYTLKRWIQQGR